MSIIGSLFAKSAPLLKQAPRGPSRSLFLWPTLTPGQMIHWQVGDYRAYAEDGFAANAIIYAALMYKVRALQAAPMLACVGERASPEIAPDDHPLNQLLRRPNLNESWYEFMGLCDVYLNLAGNVYIHPVRRRPGELPYAMQVLRPDWVRIVPSRDQGILGYLYMPGMIPQSASTPLLPEDIIHVKLPNPVDPLGGMGYGLSPMAAMSSSADVDGMVSTYLRQFFTHYAVPAGLLRFQGAVTEEDASLYRARWRERYGGMEHWTDIGILDQGAEFQRLGMTFEELGFDAIDERNESRMLAPLGVPAILLSTRLGLSRSTYSNYEQAKAQFWTDTFKPELQLFEVEFQNALKMDDGSWPAFDFSEIAVLQRNVVPLTGAAYQMWQMGVPANTAFRVAGIPNMPDIVGGDVGYLPPTLVPVGVTPQPSAAVAPGARRQTEMARETEVAQGKSLLPSAPQRPPLTLQRKAVLWRSMDRTARAWERKFRDAARAQFSLDLRALLAALGDRQKAMIQRKESVDWAEVGDDWEQILANAKDRWREAFVPLIQGVVSHQGERLALAFGMQFDVRNFLGEKWLRDYTLRFAQPIMDTTKGAVKAIVQDALEKGSSIPQMQQRLTALFETWAGDRELTEEDRQWFLERLPANRTEMIARTETIRASNAGAEALYRDWGVTQKQWLATQDDRTRPDHLDADGQVVGMEESFSVGGEGLMYPGDPSGSPDNTINCRCTVLPVMVNE